MTDIPRTPHPEQAQRVEGAPTLATATAWLWVAERSLRAWRGTIPEAAAGPVVSPATAIGALNGLCQRADRWPVIARRAEISLRTLGHLPAPGPHHIRDAVRRVIDELRDHPLRQPAHSPPHPPHPEQGGEAPASKGQGRPSGARVEGATEPEGAA